MSQIAIGISETKVELSFGGMYGMQLIASKLNGVIYGTAMGMVILLAYVFCAFSSIALATLEAVCASYQVFDYFIFKFGREELFEITVFYATRIWNLTGHLAKHYQLLTYPVILLALLQVGKGNPKTFPNPIMIPSIPSKMIVLQGVSAATCDVAIATSFSFIFQSNRSGINSRTHSLLSKFIIYAINRAAVTSVCALLTIFLYHYLLGAYCYISRGSLQEEDHSFRLTDIVQLSSMECNTDTATPT
ncbi:hypothetical protein BDQ17DRAFT_1382646 [Cyathus striatus]|nr:hypothetical protein BDQ17DRAFT_1382646 [Cyathus striatus]